MSLYILGWDAHAAAVCVCVLCAVCVCACVCMRACMCKCLCACMHECMRTFGPACVCVYVGGLTWSAETWLRCPTGKRP